MPEPSPAPDAAPDRLPPVTRSAWCRLATWAVDYPGLIGLLDVWLYRRGGYRWTITAATRSVFAAYPVVALFVGLAVGGLTCHFFGSFPGSDRLTLARALFAAGVVAGALAMFGDPLYG